MADAVRGTLTDNSPKDLSGDKINGSEVDANPYALADILDGDTQVDLGGDGPLYVRDLRARSVANAAASIQDVLYIEWDPADGGNMTDTSSGVGIVWRMPDDADVQNDFARLDVVCLDDSAGAEIARMDFYLADASGAPVSQIQLTNGALSPTTDGDINLGTTSLRYGNVYTDSIGDSGQALAVAATTLSFDASSTIDASGNGLSLGSSENIYVGDSANANMTQGLTLNQGANDDEILAGKSSDITHGLTSQAETDTYFALRKISATQGGLSLRALCEDDTLDATLQVYAFGGTASTAKTTGADALISLNAAEHNGANALANITADGNVFTVRAYVGGSYVARFLVDEDGDLYSVTAAQTFDDHDDIALVNTYDKIRSGFEGWAKEHEEKLVELKVLGAPVAEGGLTNVTQLQRLHNGALRQLSETIQLYEGRVQKLEKEIKLLKGAA